MLHTLASERTIGLSMMPLRKMRSMSLAPVVAGNSPRLSNTCCIAARIKRELLRHKTHLQHVKYYTPGSEDRAKDSPAGLNKLYITITDGWNITPPFTVLSSAYYTCLAILLSSVFIWSTQVISWVWTSIVCETYVVFSFMCANGKRCQVHWLTWYRPSVIINKVIKVIIKKKM